MAGVSDYSNTYINNATNGQWSLQTGMTDYWTKKPLCSSTFFLTTKKKCSSTVCNMHKPEAGIDGTNFDLSDQMIL